MLQSWFCCLRLQFIKHLVGRIAPIGLLERDAPALEPDLPFGAGQLLGLVADVVRGVQDA